jgi:hypothetical protein
VDAAGITGIITALAGLITAITALVRGNQHRAQINPGTVQAQIDQSISNAVADPAPIGEGNQTH